jgi:hypothetical protein
MTTKTLTTLSPQEAHAEALAAWRDSARQQALADMAVRFDQRLLEAIEKRANEAIAIIGG